MPKRPRKKMPRQKKCSPGVIVTICLTAAALCTVAAFALLDIFGNPFDSQPDATPVPTQVPTPSASPGPTPISGADMLLSSGDSAAFTRPDGLYIIEPGQAEARLYEGDGITDIKFSPSGKYLAFRRKDDLLLADNASGIVKRLAHADGGGVHDFTWGAKKDVLYAVEGADSRIRAYDPVENKADEIAPHQSKQQYAGLAVSPDGASLYYTSLPTRKPGGIALYGLSRLDLENQTSELLVTGESGFWPEIAGVSGDGRWVHLFMRDSVYLDGGGEHLLSSYSVAEKHLYEHNIIIPDSGAVLPMNDSRILLYGGKEQKLTLYDCLTDKTEVISETGIQEPGLSADRSKAVFADNQRIWITDMQKNKPSTQEIYADNKKALPASAPQMLFDGKTIIFIYKGGAEENHGLWLLDTDSKGTALLAGGAIGTYALHRAGQAGPAEQPTPQPLALKPEPSPVSTPRPPAPTPAALQSAPADNGQPATPQPPAAAEEGQAPTPSAPPRSSFGRQRSDRTPFPMWTPKPVVPFSE
ncbi:MAG: hypothetical protein FWH04_09040 [Oscillospiraceae bacterium]|nr:hypothetical protein [Oscillospiraceae bacterium]